ncbi:NADH-ubiquinone oxidoreductase kd subunit [Penicillium manginii]|uniref:NADH-ubiquinone oxidoreductase kd subunit n=1 Tax=Penicillium manginii TaxID=203109 RepID=UPI002548881A|nr:NADH-ubiquinone oxidoreductase kd subunit [Penicillium manginii]KAJ5764125.1 NADH-ubiquinone oxidoreductase kd subunit [Penicillium manginii]
MASGFGNNLGPNRCFPFWQELLGCYVVNSSEGLEGKKKCIPALEDYHECLHHTKEVYRALRIAHAVRKTEAASARENGPKAEEIRSLGLLGKDKETAATLEKIRQQ